MRYVFLLIALITVSSVGANTASANDWMFGTSYYSHAAPVQLAADGSQIAGMHEPMFPQPVPRSAYRPAYAQIGPGFSVRGKYRYSYFRLRSGLSQDTTIYRNFTLEATGTR